jgi:hypothetical protein
MALTIDLKRDIKCSINDDICCGLYHYSTKQTKVKDILLREYCE